MTIFNGKLLVTTKVSAFADFASHDLDVCELYLPLEDESRSTPKAPTGWCPCKRNRKVAAHDFSFTMVSERFIMIYVSIYNLWMFMENITPIYKLIFNPMKLILP